MSLTTPGNIRTLQRKLYLKAKAEPGYRFYLLYDKIYRPDILLHAYELVHANKGAPGVDSVTCAMIEAAGREDWLAGIATELRTKTYRPQPVRRVMIPKPGGNGERPLGIPTIRDRVVQTAAKLVLEPIFAVLRSSHHRRNQPCTLAGLLSGKGPDLRRWLVMAQHFLLSAAARSLSAAKVMRMSDSGVVNVFLRLRWPETDGQPVCPGCGCMICYACPRSPDRLRWRCKACRGDFSITSGTLFAHHKLPLRTYLLAVVAFCNEVKGHSMLALSRELDVQYKTAFVRAHKMREAMASGSKALRIGGAGREVELDGAYFGGHVRPENLAADRVGRRLAENRSGKRQVVVV